MSVIARNEAISFLGKRLPRKHWSSI